MNKPIKTINKNVPAVDVAKYYLEIELYKFFDDPSDKVVNTIKKSIRELKESKVWALLEAMSFTYHLNGVFYNISRENYTWKEEVWHVNDLILTGMDSAANKVIFSDEVDGDALKFKAYLLDYFERADKNNDPGNLMSYKPSNKEIEFKKLLMRQQDGKIQMLDGSHRLVEMLLNDVEEVVGYVGHPNSEEAWKSPKHKVGKSIFILLTILFKKGDDQEKEAVLKVLNRLAEYGTDGKENAIKYWIKRQRDEEIKEAGKQILT